MAYRDLVDNGRFRSLLTTPNGRVLSARNRINKFFRDEPLRRCDGVELVSETAFGSAIALVKCLRGSLLRPFM